MTLRSVLGSLAVLYLAATMCACRARRAPVPSAAADDASAAIAPPVPEVAEAAVRRIESRDEVALKGFRVEAKKGDWLLDGGSAVAVVSATRGAVIDYGLKGREDALVMMDEAVFMGLEATPAVVESVGPAVAGQKAVLVQRRLLSDPPMRLWTYVTFARGTLRLESVATAGSKGALAVTLGEVVAWGNTPTWVEGHGFAEGPGSWSGSFLAREGFGVAYALGHDFGGSHHVLGRFATPSPGFSESARTGERVENIPPNGTSERRGVDVAVAEGLGGDAAVLLPGIAVPEKARKFLLPKGLPPGAFVEAEGSDGLPFAHFAATGRSVSISGGDLRLRMGAPGYAPGAWLDPPPGDLATAPKAMPRAGSLRWAIREKGASVIPARLVFHGLGNPDPDWGTDPTDGASLNVLYTDHDGERPIPPGRYRVTVNHGPEYTQAEEDIVVQEGKTTAVEAELARVVDTSGWISADLHVHAMPSPDAPSPLADRVVALAAAGVEVAVATDHNAITDYGPMIRERGLGTWLASIVGDEVTTRGVLMGHFNVFPLPPAAEPIAFDRVTPSALLASAREGAADPRIVQMNHPRMGSIGYLELLRFDPRDVKGWKARTPLAELGFDAIEVYNGDHYDQPAEVDRVLGDWYALLDAGIRITATGNSDSHRITYHEAGVPRNFVRVNDDAPPRLDEKEFVQAVRAGKVVVSSGPFVRLEVAGRGLGEEAPAGDDEVHVTVDAPDWVDVSRVEVVVHGKTIRTFGGPFHAGVRRLDAKFAVKLVAGDWVIAVARGDRPMTYLPRAGAKPLAFTNPVWVR
jgi:hypothetical protein